MMDRFLLDLLRTPESQRDPYAWGCVFGSHLAFGMMAWIVGMLIFSNPESATKFSITLYFGWEFGQFLMKRTMAVLWDSILDLVSWASMSFAVYEIWSHNIWNSTAYAGGAMIIMMVGICKRLRK